MPKTFFIAIKKILGAATPPRGIISKKSSYRRLDKSISLYDRDFVFVSLVLCMIEKKNYCIVYLNT